MKEDYYFKEIVKIGAELIHLAMCESYNDIQEVIKRLNKLEKKANEGLE